MEQQLNYENIEKHFLKGACIVMLTGPPKSLLWEGRKEGRGKVGRKGGRKRGREGYIGSESPGTGPGNFMF